MPAAENHNPPSSPNPFSAGGPSVLFAKRKRNLFKGPSLSIHSSSTGRGGTSSGNHSRSASASGLGRRSGEITIQEEDEEALEFEGEEEIEEVDHFSPILHGPGETIEEIYETIGESEGEGEGWRGEDERKDADILVESSTRRRQRTGATAPLPFKFDPGSDDNGPFAVLPAAKTVLVTFPLKGEGQAARLVSAYAATHPGALEVRYIQFGVTSIWTAQHWLDEDSPYDDTNPRAVAEDELMRCAPAAVLSLAGLYGADRQPRNWVHRVVASKDDLKAKGALHVVHGEDVARAVVALHRQFTPGKRWIVCDMHVYDWWDLVQDWAMQSLSAAPGAVSEAEMARQGELLAWVGELMVEEDVRALPRDTSSIGRRLDGRGFWTFMGIWPTQGRIR
ncbi:hypothetical protein E0Z10_g5739 [Xylaria hypoxylon]|uniref:Uncharacterized protein n=1 Tax=Xylaria hypoxylon TaxID=37992 RepID=A0A4Z0YX54_9PEZI|nr:hypothetical protein E0Z10_g5739 [Xylaria hypoxylon]